MLAPTPPTRSSTETASSALPASPNTSRPDASAIVRTRPARITGKGSTTTTLTARPPRSADDASKRPPPRRLGRERTRSSALRLQVDQPERSGPRHRLQSRLDTELAVQLRDVGLDRPR